MGLPAALCKISFISLLLFLLYQFFGSPYYGCYSLTVLDRLKTDGASKDCSSTRGFISLYPLLVLRPGTQNSRER